MFQPKFECKYLVIACLCVQKTIPLIAKLLVQNHHSHASRQQHTSQVVFSRLREVTNQYCVALGRSTNTMQCIFDCLVLNLPKNPTECALASNRSLVRV